MAHTHLNVQAYDVSQPTDITSLGQGRYEELLWPCVFRRDKETESAST